MVKIINIDTKTRTIRVSNADGDIKAWRTTESGAHFPIKKGESTKEALDKFIAQKRPTADKEQAEKDNGGSLTDKLASIKHKIKIARGKIEAAQDMPRSKGIVEFHEKEIRQLQKEWEQAKRDAYFGPKSDKKYQQPAKKNDDYDLKFASQIKKGDIVSAGGRDYKIIQADRNWVIGLDDKGLQLKINTEATFDTFKVKKQQPAKKESGLLGDIPTPDEQLKTPKAREVYDRLTRYAAEHNKDLQEDDMKHLRSLRDILLDDNNAAEHVEKNFQKWFGSSKQQPAKKELTPEEKTEAMRKAWRSDKPKIDVQKLRDGDPDTVNKYMQWRWNAVYVTDGYDEMMKDFGSRDGYNKAMEKYEQKITRSQPKPQQKQSSQPTSYDLDDAFEEADLGSEWGRVKHRMDFHGVSQYTIKDIIDSGKYEAGDIIEALQSSSHDKIDEMRESLKK